MFTTSGRAPGATRPVRDALADQGCDPRFQRLADDAAQRLRAAVDCVAAGVGSPRG